MKRLKQFILLLMRIINYCVPVDKNSLYFIPHPNCNIDKYDIINYSSDNTLVLFNYLIRRNGAEKYKIYIEVYDFCRISEYEKYVYSINPEVKCVFLCACAGRFFRGGIPFKSRIYSFFCFCQSSKCFTSTFDYNFSFKKKKQKTVCLCYYTPFKDDYHIGNCYYNEFRQTASASFDHCVTTSMLSSKIISLDSGIPYSRFEALGFPRNDLLIGGNDGRSVKNYISELAGYRIDKLLIYTPTYRDYEVGTNVGFRSILGYIDCDLMRLSTMLVESNAVLVLKLHPLQNKYILKKDLPDGMILFEPTYKYGLYDLLSLSDGLITDYTSTYFDFILLNKPVIFNFYDINEYRKARGFSFEPIELFCAGDIVKKYDELIEGVARILSGNDSHMQYRQNISLLMNECHDADSTEKIYNTYLR